VPEKAPEKGAKIPVISGLQSGSDRYHKRRINGKKCAPKERGQRNGNPPFIRVFKAFQTRKTRQYTSLNVTGACRTS